MTQITKEMAEAARRVLVGADVLNLAVVHRALREAEAARPAPQAGEVADVITTIDAILARPGLNPTLLLQRCRNIIAAQAAEIEFLKGHQEGDAESIAALTALIAGKNAEIAELQKVRDFAISAHDGQVQDKDCIASQLAAKDAEIVRLKQDAHHDAGWILALRTRQEELEAALRPFAEYYASLERNGYLDGFDLISRRRGEILGHAAIQAPELQAANSALAPVGKEVKS